MHDYRLYNGMWIYKNAPHTEQALDQAQIQQILQTGGWALRNAYDFDRTEEPTNFWYVIKDQYGDLNELSTKTRNQVRRALKNYTFQKLDKDFMLAHGYEVYKRASESYAVTATPPTPEAYRERILSTTEQDEFWGAIHTESGRLVAIGINHITEDTCDYRALKAFPEDMKNYVYYGLIHTMNEYYLQTKGFRYVCDGARTASNHSNIQPFLMDKFNFRKAYCHMHITYKVWMYAAILLLMPWRRWIPFTKIKTLLALHAMQDK